VKCDRARPVCTQCKQGEKKCQYVDQTKPKFEFVNEPRNTATGSDDGPTPSSGTWGSVIDNQVDLIKKADHGKDRVPVWAVAEAEEVSVGVSSDSTAHLDSLLDHRYCRCMNLSLGHMSHR
jgi:hypothetical protein